MKFGNLKNMQVQSPLEGMAQVRPQNSGKNLAAVVAPLMLTSLVDAFAVIVIYLLVSTTQGKKALDIEKQIKLPVAKKTQMIEPGVNLRIVKNKYMISDEEYTLPEILEKMKTLNSQFKDSSDPRLGNLVIQADKDSDYKALSPILSVASQTGFDTIKFATLEE